MLGLSDFYFICTDSHLILCHNASNSDLHEKFNLIQESVLRCGGDFLKKVFDLNRTLSIQRKDSSVTKPRVVLITLQDFAFSETSSLFLYELVPTVH